jgi:hypothetical protein
MNFEARLRNWAAVMRWHSSHTSRCRSLEGAYRSPQCWTETLHAPAAPRDLKDALVVEQAWRQLSPLPRLILKANYVLALDKHAACRAIAKLLHIRVNPAAYSAHLSAAERELQKVLDSEQRTLYFRVKVEIAAYA